MVNRIGLQINKKAVSILIILSVNKSKFVLYFLDKVRFIFVIYFPSGWRNIEKYLSIYSYHSRRLNVLGIMNLNEHLVSFSQKFGQKGIYLSKKGIGVIQKQL